MSILAIVLLTKECDQKQLQTISENNATEEFLRVSKQEQDSLAFTYRTSTRGFFEIIWVNKDSISFAKERDFKDKVTFACPEKEWDELMGLYTALDTKILPELEPPSTTFRHDEKPMATLKIDTKDESYITNGFDHGRPPKLINELVNKLISMKEEVQKN